MKRAEVIETADECIQMSRNLNIAGLWWNLTQTSAVALMQLGDEENKKNGRREMRGLLKGRRPGPDFPRPPSDWLLEIWKECFPSNDSDPFGLGASMPYPGNQPEQSRRDSSLNCHPPAAS